MNNILSLFDGISCAQLALNKAGIKYDNYFASEMDKYAIQVTQKNFPNTIQLGDVRSISGKDVPDIFLLIGGSPCQNVSIAGDRKGLNGEKSRLFWEYVRLLKECDPKWFILENVASMSKESKDIISKELGVAPIMINSALVSAQQRKRLYWSNIPGISQPVDKGIYLKDILESGFTEKEKSYCITATYSNACLRDYFENHSRQLIFIFPEATKKCHVEPPPNCGVDLTYPNSKTRRGRKMEYKPNCLMAIIPNYYWNDGYQMRMLTPLECERLQTIPDGYTEGISTSQRYKTIGNAFTVDIITHILNFIRKITIFSTL